MKTVDNEFQEVINASCKSPSNRTDAANVISHTFFQHTTYLRSDLDLGSVAAREKKKKKKTKPQCHSFASSLHFQ